MSLVTPESQRNLTTMLDRWVGILKTLGVENPNSDRAPKSVTLRMKNETVTLNAPRYVLERPSPLRHHSLGYANTVTAQREIDGVPHALHLTSSQEPHVLAVKDGKFVVPLTTAPAMLSLCLHGEIVQG